MKRTRWFKYDSFLMILFEIQDISIGNVNVMPTLRGVEASLTIDNGTKMAHDLRYLNYEYDLVCWCFNCSMHALFVAF